MTIVLDGLSKPAVGTIVLVVIVSMGIAILTGLSGIENFANISTTSVISAGEEAMSVFSQFVQIGDVIKFICALFVVLVVYEIAKYLISRENKVE